MDNLEQELAELSREVEQPEETRSYPIEMHCSVLEGKTGNGRIEIFEREVNCKFFVEKTDTRREDYSKDVGLIIYHKGCALKQDSKGLFKKRRFFPYGSCPFYQEYSDTHGDIYWTNPEDKRLNISPDQRIKKLKEKNEDG
ncbi:MAG: hypothetical protein ABIH72_02605 [archaeon]